MADIKTISLTNYMEKYGKGDVPSLWVLNRSKPTRANIDFPVRSEGSITVVSIPASFIPVDITMQVPLHVLKNDTIFRRALSSGDIVICDNESVTQMFNNDQRARDEYKRLTRNDWSADDSNDVTLDDETGLDDDTDVGSEGNATYSDNEIVQRIIESSRAGDDSSDVINAIMQQLDLLTAEDLQTIANNVSDSSVKELCTTSMRN